MADVNPALDSGGQHTRDKDAEYRDGWNEVNPDALSFPVNEDSEKVEPKKVSGESSPNRNIRSDEDKTTAAKKSDSKDK